MGLTIKRRHAHPQAVNKIYLDTARLLTQVTPVVFQSGIFALKGGTAINLFIRDMPRLSVDLDLVFVDHAVPREDALEQIGNALNAASGGLRKRGFARASCTTLEDEQSRAVEG